MEPNIPEEVEVGRGATVRRVPNRILGTEVKKLHNLEIKLVKVQWTDVEEDATWETERKICAAHPFLFEGTSLISFSISLFMLKSIFQVYLLSPILYP